MAKEDWAIVVGITHYSDPVEFPPLNGPENDAKSFRSWLIDPKGGAVPRDHVTLIVSSQYPPRAASAKKDPSELAVELAFLKYDAISRRNIAAGRGQRVGRRLYVYLAGHGHKISSDSDGVVVLLTANATKDQVGHHLAGELWANNYRDPVLFAEVILLMDCCALDLPWVPLRRPPVSRRREPGAELRWLYAVGAQPGRNAYEKPFGSKVGGVFTRTLLRGLRGAASEPNGNITADSLHRYIVNNMGNLLTPEERDDRTISQIPVVTNSEPPGRFLIANADQMKCKVDFHAHAGDEGKELTVSDSNRSVVFRKVVKANELVETSLMSGLYMWELGDRERWDTFNVSDTEEVNHVEL